MYATPEAVTWEGSSGLTQLLTIATVCNKAKYDDAGATPGDCAPVRTLVAIMGRAGPRAAQGCAVLSFGR